MEQINLYKQSKLSENTSEDSDDLCIITEKFDGVIIYDKKTTTSEVVSGGL